MFCKKCGSVLGEDLICPVCGYKNEMEKGLSDVSAQEEQKEQVKAETKKEEVETAIAIEKIEKNDSGEGIVRNKVWAWISGILFVVSLFPLCKGYDKMVHYYSSETFSSLNKNAYVGGDAYNYIINAGYATAFFVLAMGCALLGVGFLIVYYISGEKVK